MEFEWDKRMAANNLKKHRITFLEAATVFGDPLAITFDDPDLSIREDRFLTFGRSRFNRLLIVSHSEKKGKIRLISSRQMTKHERKIYEQT